MISDQVRQLVEDVFSEVRNPEAHQRAKEDPEAHLVSLLTRIKEELGSHRKHRAVLYSTVEQASYEGYIQKAKEEMEEHASH